MKAVVQDLFPIPLLTDNLPVTFRTLEYIKSVEYFRHETGYMSHRQLLDDPQMAVMKNLITQRVEYYLYNCCGYSKDLKPELIASWTNLHKKGDYGQMHYHQNSLLTFVWYPQVEEHSGTFTIYRKMDLLGDTFAFPINQYNKYNPSVYSFRPKNGDLFVFPSHMRHEVQELRYEFDRYSLAGNYMISGPINITPCSNITVNCEYK
tara:strand:+ start:44 stop:661 length:618 start_codon:yes stop_codon:yes gene_type:complete